MNSRSSYSQKKKKEALRRLSQGGIRGKRTSLTASPDDPHRQARVSRRVRHQRDSIDDELRNPRRGILGGRRVIATDSPSSGTHLVIQASVGGQSLGTDTPDTDPDTQRRLVTSQASPKTKSPSLFGKSADLTSNPASGGIFATGGMFGSPQKAWDKPRVSESGSELQGSQTRKSLFQAEHSNLFPARGQFGSKSTSIFQSSADSSGNVFGQAVSKNPFAEHPQASSSLDTSPAKGSDSFSKSEEPARGLDSATRNLFGKPPPKMPDPRAPLFGKPPTKPDQTSAFPPKSLFGKEPEPKPRSRVLFGKASEPSGGREHGNASSKRQLSPGRPEAAPKRTLTSFEDPFSSGSSDITDLETFGADTFKRDAREKKPVIKRSGLFGKAIAEASGKSRDSTREAHKSGSHNKRRESPSRSRSPEEKKHRSPEKKLEDERKKQRQENKPARRSSASGSSSRRYASPEELKSLVCIIIKGIPSAANSRLYLKDFFSKYGPVARVIPNPNKRSAFVYFRDHESAVRAKRVKVLMPDTKPVTIFWRQAKDEEKPSSSSRKEIKETGARQSLAPYNRKVEAKVNPEDGSGIVSHSASTVSTSSRPKTSNLSVPAHLLSKQIGLTAQERYDILEDRDKIIRQGLKKKSNLASAEAIRGTCPDMCPEKERYMRVVQRRLHPYEILQGSTDKVNHETAVKEYSRSSADQEEPLPHEMRPAPVLTLTMNYLMRHVMNTGRDGHWEEWFDFLWSRTRGIRKDITQQDLRDLTAIDLMEKCARFHIFCSHRLCEEDRSTIDPKINNENLTKCMQSLKQFYHDLATVCPNEAEFRAYDVLLNLNDRDILRQVQQYRMEVRSSEAVKFALKAFSAVSSNNYVKFFKLVRSTTYLNACIMHRYFMQVRNMALDVMNKAYTISNTRGSRFPLATIQTTLAFDDQSQASEFCQSHNLAVEDDRVQFNRAAFQHPDITQSAERSHAVIEAKNAMTIGEVVNGSPLPPDVPHKPSSSFDENGHYKGYTVVTAETASSVIQDAVPERPAPAETVLKPIDNQTMTAPASVPSSFPHSAAKAPYSNMVIKEVARSMFLEVIEEMVRDLSNSFLGWISLIQVGSAEILQDTMERGMSRMIREIAQGVLEEQRRHEAQMAELDRCRRLEQQAMEEERQQRALMERRERMERTAHGIFEETVDSVVNKESTMLADAEIRAVQEQLRMERIEHCSSQLHHELIEKTLLSECQRLSAEVIQAETELRDQRLAESERAVVMARTARYLQKWYRVYTKRIHLKRTLLTFPAAPPNQTAAEQLKVLWAGRGERSEVTAGHRRKDLTLDSPFGLVTGREHIARSILKFHYLKNLRLQKAWSPLDLPTLLSSSFLSHHAPASPGSYRGDQQQHHYWKLVTSLPGTGSHDREVLCDWLKAKLRRGRLSEGVRKKQLEDDSQVETLSLYSSRASHVSPSQPCSLGICTKVVTGALNPTRQRQTRHQLLGTSAILFALEPTIGGLDPGEDHKNIVNRAILSFWLQAKSRLDSILRAKPAVPPPPLVIVLLDWPATEHAQTMCEDRLSLRQLSQLGLVSSYHFLMVTGDVENAENSKELGECLEWLSSRCPPPPLLSEDSFKGYLDTGITKFFSLPLHEDATTRRDAFLPEQDCRHVIELYNATIGHLADVASSSTLTSLSWPPSEFTKTDRETGLPCPNWNASDTIRPLRDQILSLMLPTMPLINEEDDWPRVCELCQEYLQSVPGSHRGKAPLFARVKRILEKCRRTFEDTCYLAFDAPDCEPMAGHVPWTRIIEECINYTMSTVQSHDFEGDDAKQTVVYYIQSEFDSFRVPPMWKEAIHTTTEECFLHPPRFASRVAGVVQQKQTEFMERRLEATMVEMKENRKPAVTNLEREPSFVTDAKESAQAVKTELSSAKEESKKFDDLLHQWLHGTEELTSYDGTNTLRTDTSHSPKSWATPPHLEQGLQELALTMESERRADRLADLRLASLLSL